MFDIHAIRAAAYSVAVEDDGFRFLDANRACLALTAFTSGFQPGLTPGDLFPPDVAETILARYRACCAGEAVSYVASATVEAEVRSWRTTLFCAPDADGRPAVLYAICSHLEAAEPADLDLPAIALRALDIGFWTLDLASRDFRTSRGLAEKMAGPGHHSLNFAEYVAHVHADDLSLELPEAEGEVTVEFRVHTFEGRLRWFQTRRRPVRDAFGRPTHVVGIVLDITEQKLAMMRLEKEAATDRLTRVGNRRAFDLAAERCFGDEPGRRLGIVVIDLDGFKPVNDRHGHSVGDDLLREAGQRLSALIEPGHLLARIGGDEFAILVPLATAERLDILAECVERAFFEPFAACGTTIVVGASCGAAVGDARDASVGDIVARADRALYAAKDRRRRLIA